MAAILQTTFWMHFLEWNVLYCGCNFTDIDSLEFNREIIIIGWGNGLAPDWRQTITSTWTLTTKACILIQILLKYVRKRWLGNNSVLFQVVAWRRTDTKPWPESMIIYSTDEYAHCDLKVLKQGCRIPSMLATKIPQVCTKPSRCRYHCVRVAFGVMITPIVLRLWGGDC